MNIQISLEAKSNDGFFNRLASAKPLMREISLLALSAIQKNIETNIPPKNAALTEAVKKGSNTLKDSNTLRRSLTARHTETEAAVGTNVPYASSVNFGALIRPKKARYLCLPASPETRKLFRKYGWTVREVIAGLEAEGVSVYRPYKKGGGARANVIMMKKEKQKPLALFILKKEVTIPARPFMFLSDAVIEKIEQRAGDYYAS